MCLGAKYLAQPLAIELLSREPVVLLHLSLLRLRLSLQHHALAHVLGDLMNLQRLLRDRLLLSAPCLGFSPSAPDSVELALELSDARLELENPIFQTGVVAGDETRVCLIARIEKGLPREFRFVAPPRQRDHR